MSFKGIPPSDVGAEEAAIACVLQCSEQTQARQYFAQLQEPHFHAVHTLEMFRALTKIEEDGGTFNDIELREILKESGKLASIGGEATIAKLDVPSAANFPSYLAILNDRALRREKIKAAQKQIQDAENLTVPTGAGKKSDDLKSKLDARRYDPERLLCEPMSRYRLAGIPTSTAGNLTAIAAQLKAGKSASIGGMIASTFADESKDCLHWRSSNEKGLAVVHLDTEQSPFDHQELIVRAERRAGVSKAPEWIRSYCVTGFSHREVREAIRFELDRAAQKFGGIHSFILDGVAEAVADVNDPAESNDFIAELHALAIQYDCPIIGVIHLNPTSDSKTGKTRGHLGSQLGRKAETNLQLEKDADEVTSIWSNKNRRAPIPKKSAPCFAWSDKHRMHISVASNSNTSKSAKEAAKEEKFRFEMQEAFGIAGKTALHWSELLAALRRVSGINSHGTAERRALNAPKIGIIKQNLVGQWELV